MLSVSEVSERQIELFSTIYFQLSGVFRIRPDDASLRKKQDMCRWILQNCAGTSGLLPPEFFALLKDPENAPELILFLSECSKRQCLTEQKRAQRFDDFISQFDADVRLAMEEVKNSTAWLPVKPVDNDVIIAAKLSDAYCLKLVLKNAEGLPQNADLIRLKDVEILPEDREKRYCLHCTSAGIAGEGKLFFSVATVKTEVYNALRRQFSYNSPWDMICAAAREICEKEKLPGTNYSPMEAELLPLLRELKTLRFSGAAESVSFTNLKEMAGAYGHRKIRSMLTKAEKTDPTSGRYFTLTDFIVSGLLCEQACEPLWREIYGKIVQSQSGYPMQSDFEMLTQTGPEPMRKKVQRFMEQHGYSGTYPDFYKEGGLKGFRKVVHSQGVTYLFGSEKPAVYRIHCAESFDDCMTIRFVCGTALLKPGEKADDIFSCMFTAKARRMVDTVLFRLSEYADRTNNSAEPEQYLEVAVKRAECQRLTREEQKKCVNYAKQKSQRFSDLWICLWTGALFSILFHFAMWIVVLIDLSRRTGNVFQSSLQYPWGWLVLGTWFIFSGLLWVVVKLLTALGKS